MDMRDALSRMHDTLPKEISEKLDYSIESLDILDILDILEHWISWNIGYWSSIRRLKRS